MRVCLCALRHVAPPPSSSGAVDGTGALNAKSSIGSASTPTDRNCAASSSARQRSSWHSFKLASQSAQQLGSMEGRAETCDRSRATAMELRRILRHAPAPICLTRAPACLRRQQSEAQRDSLLKCETRAAISHTAAARAPQPPTGYWHKYLGPMDATFMLTPYFTRPPFASTQTLLQKLAVYKALESIRGYGFHSGSGSQISCMGGRGA